MTDTTDIIAQHPGKRLQQILEERGFSQTDLAFILGQSGKGLNLIVNEKRGITADMSKALGESLGLPHEYFADLQMAYDLARANDPDPAVTLRATMMDKYPIREMIKRGWIEDGDAEQLQYQLANFFGLSSINEIPYLAHAAKKSHYEEREIPPSQLAWLFRVRHMAKSMVAPQYSSRALSNAVRQLRGMLIAPEETRHVPRILMECGVRLVLVESLPQAKIDGVCFWLNTDYPVIGMSLRFDRIDNFWFVLRHEIEHVLRGHGVDVEMVDAELEGARTGTDDSVPQEERIANAAATDFCVPTEKLNSFMKRKYPLYYEKDVLAFAKLHQIHPGLIVGQMQYLLQRYDYLRKHQVKIRQCVLPGAFADGWKQSIPI